MTVRGVADAVDDGPRSYFVSATAASDDLNYSGLPPVSVALTNLESGGIFGDDFER